MRIHYASANGGTCVHSQASFGPNIPHPEQLQLRCFLNGWSFSLSVVHGDVKPDNILIFWNGVPKLGDYSESQRLGEDGFWSVSHFADALFHTKTLVPAPSARRSTRRPRSGEDPAPSRSPRRLTCTPRASPQRNSPASTSCM